jgi:hypothetical protein
LLEKQVAAGKALSGSAPVERLTYEGWEQTTRAVLAGAFGDPSDNVERFQRASPAYPGRVGEDEHFWAKYRRDELEAKLASVVSSVSQLQLGIGGAAESATTTAAVHPYEAARRVLKVLHHYFLEHGNRLWSISPVKDGKNNFASVGLDADGATKAFQLLVSKGLAEYMGNAAFVITEYGVTACDHPSTLDHELPIPGKDSQGAAAAGPSNIHLGVLADIGQLVTGDSLREIVTRDIEELRNAVAAGLSKCVMLLAGSILEGVLVDVLDRNRALAASYMKKRRFPEDASLQDLVSIAGDAALLDAPRHLLTPTSVVLAHAVTDHRDLIHPHAEVRGRILVDETTARGVLHLLTVVARDLMEAKGRGDITAYENK